MLSNADMVANIKELKTRRLIENAEDELWNISDEDRAPNIDDKTEFTLFVVKYIQILEFVVKRFNQVTITSQHKCRL